jgi:hypothetical protein
MTTSTTGIIGITGITSPGSTSTADLLTSLRNSRAAALGSNGSNGSNGSSCDGGNTPNRTHPSSSSPTAAGGASSGSPDLDALRDSMRGAMRDSIRGSKGSSKFLKHQHQHQHEVEVGHEVEDVEDENFAGAANGASDGTIGLVQCNLLQPHCRSAAAPLPLRCRCGVVEYRLGAIGASELVAASS